MKHIIALAALVLATSCFGQSYDLTIEQSDPAAAPGMTYRLYIESNDPTDKLSHIYGNDSSPLEMQAPSGAYNNAFNASWNGSGINPALLGFFPDLADDSFAAINSSEVTLFGDDDSQNSILNFFSGMSSTSLFADAGGWSAQCEWDLTPPTSCGALGDPMDGRWLIAQVTTTGSFSGTINAQIFPFGEGSNQIQQTWHFEGEGVISPCFGWYDDCGVCYGNNSSCSGCTDPVACNYDPTMLLDDGSCDYCFCGPGTEYDTESGQCLIVVEDAGYCGPGTYWVEALNKCFISTPGDTDFDGCVGVADLLGLLSIFGNCEGQEVAAWSCGDELEYQGDMYATVEIGEQCWFGDNLQNAAYRNGDPLSPSTTWAYGADDGECFSLSPDGDACDEGWSYSEYGRLYSWVAVNDDRGLCPTGWHVPSDAEWMDLEMALGMDAAEVTGTGFRGTDQGAQLKSTYGYDQGGNGSNSSGFSGLPGGFRTTTPVYNSAGYYGNWWTSSPGGVGAFLRFICYDTDQISRGTQDQGFGLSVRCIQDSE